MCTYMSLDTNETNSPYTTEMYALSIGEIDALATSEMNVLNASKVNALSLLWVLFHISCISNLILALR